MTSMHEQSSSAARKAATAARMYDYYLGGIHNFPADRAAADAVVKMFPFVRDAARANRGFVVNAVRYLAGEGVRQFLDVGAGIPTVDNVHSVARKIQPEARVVYADIDPVAVAEGQEILADDGLAAAVRGDLQAPRALLEHPEVRRILDFGEPIGLLLAAVLHFIPDHRVGEEATAELVAALPSGSYLVVSHTAKETFSAIDQSTITENVYQRRTATPGTTRTRAEVERLFAGVDIQEPGVVWAQEWSPGPASGQPQPAGPGGIWAGVGKKP
ncbi:SAM-dependent methyltransferase [Dactylosporangium sp. CA-092794]|uniref:SAM-dependent methyltransferase n=1 Tax=Dactylosporangium sp. CA-092794 TaxID=3239929 RepID=UPI003D8EF4E7